MFTTTSIAAISCFSLSLEDFSEQRLGLAAAHAPAGKIEELDRMPASSSIAELIGGKRSQVNLSLFRADRF